MAAKTRDVVIEGKRLETVSYPATRHEKTIVVLHEGLGSVSTWKDFPERIAEATGCGVLVYSRYGYGKSDRLAEKRTVDFMHYEARQVLPALLEEFQIRAPILLGHSDGGSIALIYAATFPDEPAALILEAPHVFVEDLTVESIAKIKTTFQTTDLAQKMSRHHQHFEETFWGWNDIWLDPAFRAWNIEECLEAIVCPVLVIQGENDEYGTVQQVNAIKSRIRHTEALLLVDCGHSPHRDQSELSLAAISRFVAKQVQVS